MLIVLAKEDKGISFVANLTENPPAPSVIVVPWLTRWIVVVFFSPTAGKTGPRALKEPQTVC